MKITHGPSPAPTRMCSVSGGQCTKSHAFSGRSSPSINSKHSPASTRKFSWLASRWYRPLASPGCSTASVKPTSGKPTSLPSKMQASPSTSLVTQAASGMLTTNQPSVTGARPVSSRSSRASSTIGLVAALKLAHMVGEHDDRFLQLHDLLEQEIVGLAEHGVEPELEHLLVLAVPLDRILDLLDRGLQLVDALIGRDQVIGQSRAGRRGGAGLLDRLLEPVG